jgi:hypothetical protein
MFQKKLKNDSNAALLLLLRQSETELMGVGRL